MGYFDNYGQPGQPPEYNSTYGGDSTNGTYGSQTPGSVRNAAVQSTSKSGNNGADVFMSAAENWHNKLHPQAIQQTGGGGVGYTGANPYPGQANPVYQPQPQPDAGRGRPIERPPQQGGGTPRLVGTGDNAPSPWDLIGTPNTEWGPYAPPEAPPVLVGTTDYGQGRGRPIQRPDYAPAPGGVASIFDSVLNGGQRAPINVNDMTMDFNAKRPVKDLTSGGSEFDPMKRRRIIRGGEGAPATGGVGGLTMNPKDAPTGGMNNTDPRPTPIGGGYDGSGINPGGMYGGAPTSNSVPGDAWYSYEHPWTPPGYDGGKAPAGAGGMNNTDPRPYPVGGGPNLQPGPTGEFTPAGQTAGQGVANLGNDVMFNPDDWKNWGTIGSAPINNTDPVNTAGGRGRGIQRPPDGGGLTSTPSPANYINRNPITGAVSESSAPPRQDNGFGLTPIDPRYVLPVNRKIVGQTQSTAPLPKPSFWDDATMGSWEDFQKSKMGQMQASGNTVTATPGTTANTTTPPNTVNLPAPSYNSGGSSSTRSTSTSTTRPLGSMIDPNAFTDPYLQQLEGQLRGAWDRSSNEAFRALRAQGAMGDVQNSGAWANANADLANQLAASRENQLVPMLFQGNESAQQRALDASLGNLSAKTSTTNAETQARAQRAAAASAAGASMYGAKLGYDAQMSGDWLNYLLGNAGISQRDREALLNYNTDNRRIDSDVYGMDQRDRQYWASLLQQMGPEQLASMLLGNSGQFSPYPVVK